MSGPDGELEELERLKTELLTLVLDEAVARTANNPDLSIALRRAIAEEVTSAVGEGLARRPQDGEAIADLVAKRIDSRLADLAAGQGARPQGSSPADAAADIRSQDGPTHAESPSDPIENTAASSRKVISGVSLFLLGVFVGAATLAVIVGLVIGLGALKLAPAPRAVPGSAAAGKPVSVSSAPAMQRGKPSNGGGK